MTKKTLAAILLSAMLLSVLWITCSFSDKGRIEVRWTQGAPENIVKDFEKKRTYVSFPDECKEQNGQCAVLTLSNVRLYFYKRKISFNVVGDGKIKIELTGVRGKKGKPVYNDYSFFKINGQNVTNDKKELYKIGFDRTFVKEIPVKNGDTVTLEAKLKIHSGKAEYSKILRLFLSRFVFLFLIFSAMIKIFTSKYVKNFFDFMARIRAENIASGYKSIDPVYRKAFWIVFGIINFVFCFHTVTFMWGNHDWGFIYDSISWKADLYMGRYSAHWIKNIFLDGRYLPVISNVLTFAGLALTSVLLCIYWKVKKNVLAFVLCGLALSIQPFTLEWLYYVSALPDLYIMPAFVITGFILADSSVETGSIRKKICLNLMAVAFMNFGLGTYPPFLNILAVVFTGAVTLELIRGMSLTQTVKSKSAALLDIVLACLSYKAVLIYSEKAGILSPSMYTIQSLPLKEMPQRIVKCVKAAIEQLFTYDFPFMPNAIAVIFTVLLGLAIINILSGKENIRKKALVFVMLAGALLATKSAAIIAKSEQFFVPRIDAFGLIYFRVLTIAVLFEAGRITYRNITIFLTSVSLWISAVNDFRAQNVWKQGFEAEKMRWNRMLFRLETQDAFDPDETYDIVQIGNFSGARKNFYAPQKAKRGSSGLLGHSYDPKWSPFRAQKFFYSDVLKTNLHFNSIYAGDNREYIDAITDLYAAGVLQKAQAWPKENSLIVYKNIILLVADEKELEAILEKMEQKKTD